MTTIIDGTTGITFPSAIAGVSATQQYSGRVLQVVQGTTTTSVSRTTAGTVDTGLTATITPTSSTSKILVIAHHNGVRKQTVNCYMEFYLLRGASTIALMALAQGYTGSTSDNQSGTVSTCYLDSPATTSATTYKTQFGYAGSAGGTCSIQINSDVSSITLMEIAA